MSKLVKAIKTYAYMDRGDVVQADVHEGLDSTLIMLKHKLKHTQIKVKRDYDESLPKLTMRGSELNQVWTNLLDNAIGALGEHGTITVHDDAPTTAACASTSPTTARASPPTCSAHVFDPFFTTKAPGSGTGMGLDTARRIVEQRHRGSLTFDTGEGGTTFHVWLPLERTIAMTSLRPPGHDHDHSSCRRRSRAARTACATGGVWLHLRICLALRARRLLRRLAQQARDAPTPSPASTRYPLARARRGLVLLLPRRHRDADPAGQGADADPALADAVALNSASAAASTRPSLHGGPVSWTPTGSPRSSKPTGTAHVGRPARSCGTVKGSTPSRNSWCDGCEISSGGTAAIGVISRSAAANRRAKAERMRSRVAVASA